MSTTIAGLHKGLIPQVYFKDTYIYNLVSKNFEIG